MRLFEIFQDDDEYWPTKLKMSQRYRNPFDPRTGEHNPGFKDDQHIPNMELADEIDSLIDQGIEPQVTRVPINQLHASQDWLSSYGSGEDTFPDYTDLPVVLKMGSELVIADGHHRISKKAQQGLDHVQVYLFKV